MIAVRGDKELFAEFNKLKRKYPLELAASLLQEGEGIVDKSQDLVPVDTGILKRSKYVAPPRWSGASKVEVVLGYGTNYALPVHERLNAQHNKGQAKYLEQPLKEAKAGLLSRLVDRIRANVRIGTYIPIAGSRG